MWFVGCKEFEDKVHNNIKDKIQARNRKNHNNTLTVKFFFPFFSSNLPFIYNFIGYDRPNAVLFDKI